MSKTEKTQEFFFFKICVNILISLLYQCIYRKRPTVNYWNVMLFVLQWTHWLTRRHMISKWRQNKPCISPIWLATSWRQRRCSAVNKKTVCSCCLVLILDLKPDLFVKQCMENNLNISNKFNLFNVHWNMNNNRSWAKINMNPFGTDLLCSWHDVVQLFQWTLEISFIS